jgi:hypothetical protein
MKLPRWLRRALGLDVPRRVAARHVAEVESLSLSTRCVEEAHDRLLRAVRIERDLDLLAETKKRERR